MENIYVTKALLPEYEEYCKAIKPLWENHIITNMGHHHKLLEQELLRYLEAENISLFCNGHMALELTLQALELKGEVITTPFTFISTIHAIVRNDLTPVFCDVDPETYTMDADKIEALITPNTTAIVPVHVYGNVCNVEKIDMIARKYKLKVIYDAAHAFGVKYKGISIGDFGDASMFSFHATKVFNSIEGGAITFSDNELKQKLHYLKNFGIKSAEQVEDIGTNAKMNEFSAIMGLCNLKQVDDAINERKRVFERYIENLKDVSGIKFCNINKDQTWNYAYVPIQILDTYGKSRDYLFDKLSKKGIIARKYFYPIATEVACYKERNYIGDTPIAKEISERILTLPIEPTFPDVEVDTICNIIKGVANENPLKK